MTDTAEQLVDPKGVHTIDSKKFYNYLHQVLPKNVIADVGIERIEIKQFK